MPPLIEVLPTGTTTSGATWTYTTAPPPQAHVNTLPVAPNGPGAASAGGVRGRKFRPTRIAAVNAIANIDTGDDYGSGGGVGGGGGGGVAGIGGGSGGGMGKPMSRKDEKLMKHLLEFERDNARENVAIVVPKGVKTKTRTKPPTSTPTTRKILSSQKTFQNHLSDEDALLLHHTQNPPSTHPAHLSAAMRATRRDPHPPIPEVGDTTTSAWSNSTTPAHPTTATTSSEGKDGKGGVGAGAAGGVWSVIGGSAYGLPLAYNAARADASIKPRRVFCEICGYWGRYRCLRCGARYCDLECKGNHEETRCQRFWVQ